MARGRLWTEDEDRTIRDAAERNKADADGGIGIGGRSRYGRLRQVADASGRTYGAVRARAVRIGATSR